MLSKVHDVAKNPNIRRFNMLDVLDLSDVKLPFEVSDLVSSGMTMLGFIAAFVLLSLAFYFVPTMIKIIQISFGVYQDNKINAGDPKHQQKYGESIKEHLTEDRFYRRR